MDYKKIIITIEIDEDKTISDSAKERILENAEEFVNETSELHSSKGEGFVGSGLNFITGVRDFHVKCGFDKGAIILKKVL